MKISLDLSDDLKKIVFEATVTSVQNGIFYFYSVSLKATADISDKIGGSWVITQKRKDNKGVFFYVLMPIEWYIFNLTVPLSVSKNDDNSDNNKSGDENNNKNNSEDNDEKENKNKTLFVKSVDFTDVIQTEQITFNPSELINSLVDLIVNVSEKIDGNDVGKVYELKNNNFENIFINSKIKMNVQNSVNALIANTKYINIVEIVSTVYRGMGFYCVQDQLAELNSDAIYNNMYYFVNFFKKNHISFNGSFKIYGIDSSVDFTKMASNVVFGQGNDGSIKPIDPATFVEGFDAAMVETKIMNLQNHYDRQSVAIGSSYNMMTNIGLINFFNINKMEPLKNSDDTKDSNSKSKTVGSNVELKKSKSNKKTRNAYSSKILEYLTTIYSYQNSVNSQQTTFQGTGDMGVGSIFYVNGTAIIKNKQSDVYYPIDTENAFSSFGNAYIVLGVNYTISYNTKGDSLTFVGSVSCVQFDYDADLSLIDKKIDDNTTDINNEEENINNSNLEKQKEQTPTKPSPSNNLEEEPISPEEAFGGNPALIGLLASLFAEWLRRSVKKNKAMKSKKNIKKRPKPKLKPKKKPKTPKGSKGFIGKILSVCRK